jgi:type VII secretion-associated serine protease mycosin
MTRRARRRLRLVTAVLMAVSVVALAAGGAPPARADDGIQAKQWALQMLDAQQAWQISRGAGVTVAVLDTGVVPTRPDLVGSVTTGPDYAGGTDRPGSAYWGLHGTAMASIIAGHGHGPDDSDGVMGIAPEAHILSIRVIRDEQDPASSATQVADPIENGIRYAVAHGAQVISMSLGGAGGDSDVSSPIAQAIAYAIAHGVVVVASSGNDGAKGDQTEFPAGVRGVIGVGAVDQYGRWASFSSHGWDVALAAPGVGIVTDAPDHGYYQMDGTSPACAYVAGVVALLRSRYPRLSPAQITSVLEQTTQDRPAGGRDDDIGYGVVDPVAALRAAARLTPQSDLAAATPYHGARYFGFGPTIVLRSAGGFAPRARATLDIVLAILAVLLFALLVALQTRPPATRDATSEPRLGQDPR